ncbi:siderophore-interacting protein [Streptomyces vilmorinianum]|uniref:siderophore-interacting protein n=1 Tax=Streptomyces vilmorinianum TaxID=3051092 RepID=UPI0010FB0642|nr:siderophore-interacting protein [Streptomyces vilmorinianum]
MTSAETAPFQFFSLQVDRTRRLGPSLVRVTFTGEDLKSFASGGRDQSLSLFLPHPGQPEPVLPPLDNPDMYAILGAWRAMPDDERAVMRSYTVRDQRTEPQSPQNEVDIDFALHEDGGPACRWAQHAAPGDRVVVLGPAVAENTGVRFQLPDDADSVLIWADETALPAASAVLESLPAETRAHVFLEVPYSGDRLELTTQADATVTWLVREEGAPSAVDAVRAAELPGRAPYVWIAGESGAVKALRRHFVRERELDRRRVTFVGYWRKGLSEDALREVPDETQEEA